MARINKKTLFAIFTALIAISSLGVGLKANAADRDHRDNRDRERRDRENRSGDIVVPNSGPVVLPRLAPEASPTAVGTGTWTGTVTSVRNGIMTLRVGAGTGTTRIVTVAIPRGVAISNVRVGDTVAVNGTTTRTDVNGFPIRTTAASITNMSR